MRTAAPQRPPIPRLPRSAGSTGNTWLTSEDKAGAVKVGSDTAETAHGADGGRRRVAVSRQKGFELSENWERAPDVGTLSSVCAELIV